MPTPCGSFASAHIRNSGYDVLRGPSVALRGPITVSRRIRSPLRSKINLGVRRFKGSRSHELDWEDDLKSPERSAGLDSDGLEYWDTEPEPEPQEDRSRGPEPEPVQETTLDPEEKENEMDLEM
jgi:hypothetical protein